MLDFISYVRMPANDRRKFLIEMVRVDAFINSIFVDGDEAGLLIHFGYYGPSGAYRRKSEDGKPEIYLATRFGKSINAHYFLHELIHFYQDRIGLVQDAKALSLQSYLHNRLFCEAMAHVEAIKASWRSKEEHNRPEPWKGALLSFDWRGQAKAYSGWMLDGEKEKEAAQKLFRRWFQTGQKKFYKTTYARHYQNITSNHAPISEEHSGMEEVLKKLPEDLQEIYGPLIHTLNAV